VHAPLGNHFAVEVGELFQEPDILQQLRAAMAGGQDVLVIRNGNARGGGQLFFIAHLSHPFSLSSDRAPRTYRRIVRLEPGTYGAGDRLCMPTAARILGP
jgi:hypothetical protein